MSSTTACAVIFNNSGNYTELFTGSKIADLGDRFRLNLLELQKEEQLAKQGVGYPDNYNWSDWLAQRAGEKVSREARPQPFQLVLEHQLAMNGMESIADAYKALGKAVVGGDVSALGVTPGNLHAWAKAHPWEARELAGNLQHTYNIMTSPKANSFGGAVVDMVKHGWERGTAENIAKDMLMGTRDELAGVTELTPMPAAMIALLDFAGWAPYIANGVSAAQGDNLAGRIGNLLGFGPVVNVALGIVQTKVEKEIAGAVVQHRDFEVAANAVLKGMAAAGGDPVKFCKEAAGYALQRQALQEVGTIHCDIKEGGKMGAVARFREEMGLWWKHSNTWGKVRLVAAAAMAPIAMGALVTAAALAVVGTGGLGLLVVPLLGLLGAGSGALITRSMWNFLATPFGLGHVKAEVRKEMNNKRLTGEIDRLRETIQKRAQKDQSALKNQPIQGIGKISGDEMAMLRIDAQQVALQKVLDQALVLSPALLEEVTAKFGNLEDLEGEALRQAMEYVSDKLNDQMEKAAASEGKRLAEARNKDNNALIEKAVGEKNDYIADLQAKHINARQKANAGRDVDPKKIDAAVRDDVANAFQQINNQVLEQMQNVLPPNVAGWGRI